MDRYGFREINENFMAQLPLFYFPIPTVLAEGFLLM